jgi:hypothetical protein
MATVTLEYNTRNRMAQKVLSVIFAMDDVFKVKNNTVKTADNPTKQAMEDAISGNITVCDDFEDYLKKTAVNA